MKSSIRTVVIGLFGGFLGTLTIAQSSPTLTAGQSDQAKIRESRDALSRTGENHKLLARLVGTWTFTGKHIPAHVDPSAKLPEFSGTLMRHGIWEGRYFISETTGGKIAMPWADGREVVYKT